MRKICVITTTRAEYGLLYWLMKGMQEDEAITLQLVVTGTHLSASFGSTIDQIREDGFRIDRSFNLEMLDDSPTGISHSLSVAIKGFTTSFTTLKPDLLVVLGDRFELLGAAAAALICNIPVAHIHGGELTLGAIDDAIRHSITKMSKWHFTATEEYRRRVIQMGESPDRVFNVGGMGQDNIVKLKLLTKSELEENLGIHFHERNLLITYHPETLDPAMSLTHFQQLLDVLVELEHTLLLFTKPNADTGNQAISKLLDEFVAAHEDSALVFASLGQLRYLSLMKQVDAVVGNSSSGIIEAPSMHVPTLDIGNRQKGRIAAQSIVHAEPTKLSIQAAFKKIYSPAFRNKLSQIENPYGNGGASDSVLNILKEIDFSDKNPKDFYDL